jgi:hypothetical protein
MDLCKHCQRSIFAHADDCPHKTGVASLAMKRFEKDGDPTAHDPRAALEVALEWIDANPNKPDHVIVLIGRTTEDNSSGTKYFQSGKYPHHAQLGLVFEGMHMIRDSGHE